MKTLQLIIVGLALLFGVPVNAAVLNLQTDKAVSVVSSDTSKGNRHLIKFDLSSIPAGSTIDIAEVNLKVEVDTGKRYIDLAIFPVTSDWSEDAVLLTEGRVSYTDTILATETIDVTTGKIMDLNITRIVREWVKGTLPNKGLMVAPLENDFKIKSLSPVSNILPGVKAEIKIFYTGPEVKR
ncbi:MAG: hypothetical protein A2145_05940 [candidate division Zixibacteria bacterium RBG_16_40_9]|nr:MAG: hypothetical protein A2145_05940 [candidate division Zixibacteria bacterium RBG_16_40_9]